MHEFIRIPDDSDDDESDVGQAGSLNDTDDEPSGRQLGLTDDSDDESYVRQAEFMTTEELNAHLRGPFEDDPEVFFRGPHTTGTNARSQLTPAGDIRLVTSFESCLAEVLEVFPDVSHEHVKELFDAHPNVRTAGLSLAADIVSKILDGTTYPKEPDRLKERKRKRRSEAESDDERAAEWKNVERMNGNSFYSAQARVLLYKDFDEIPQWFVDFKLKELGHLYVTYLALDIAEETYATSAPRPYNKLRRPRKSSMPVTPDQMSPVGDIYHKIIEELEAARTQRKKLQSQRTKTKAAADAEAAEEKALRDSGQIMECACCFDDDVPINKVTWCSADTPHAFCLGCAARNAESQIGLSRFVLECMDGSGCKAIFSRSERQRFLDAKTIDKLERLQQQTELRQADLPNLETCPFCDFAAICDPIEVDKEFRCGNPECEKVSCRKCRIVTHIPMSCEEFKKENGVSGRHQIEEARTKALLRQCPKCKSSVFKDGGCNKIMCPCGGAVCDFCGQDITKEKYNHFRDGPTSTGNPGTRGKCPTHDNDYERNQKNMEKAEKETMAKIRKENPELSEDDLRIKFRENVKTPPRNIGYPYNMHARAVDQANQYHRHRLRDAVLPNRNPPLNPPAYAVFPAAYPGAEHLYNFYVPPHDPPLPPLRTPHHHRPLPDLPYAPQPNAVPPPPVRAPTQFTYAQHAPAHARPHVAVPPGVDFQVPQHPPWDFEAAAREAGFDLGLPPGRRRRQTMRNAENDLLAGFFGPDNMDIDGR
ncbi:MAG: hypothetical protein Q9207_001992 [Kuettlingeria erythrocarpa]